MEFINNVTSVLRGSILMTAHIRHLALREHMSRFICYRTMEGKIAAGEGQENEIGEREKERERARQRMSVWNWSRN